MTTIETTDDGRSLGNVALGCVVGLHSAAAKGREQLAISLLFGLGLLLGLAGATMAARTARRCAVGAPEAGG